VGVRGFCERPVVDRCGGISIDVERPEKHRRVDEDGAVKVEPLCHENTT